jgi:hypothetical protein
MMTELEQAIAYKDLTAYTLDEVKKWVPVDAAGHERKGRLLKTLEQLEALAQLQLQRQKVDHLADQVKAWMEAQAGEFNYRLNRHAPMWPTYEAESDKLKELRDKFKT